MTLYASELRHLRREVTRLNRRLALAHVEGEVAERDEKNWKIRIRLGEDEDGKPILSPWLKPHANSAGAYAYSPPLPAVGNRMRMMSPSGVVGAASYAVPSTFDDDMKRPNADKDESARSFGKTRLSQTKEKITAATEKTSVTQTKDVVAVKAGKKAEIEADEARIKGKTTRIHGESLEKIKIIVGDQAYHIRPEALLPTSA